MDKAKSNFFVYSTFLKSSHNYLLSIIYFKNRQYCDNNWFEVRQPHINTPLTTTFKRTSERSPRPMIKASKLKFWNPKHFRLSKLQFAGHVYFWKQLKALCTKNEVWFKSAGKAPNIYLMMRILLAPRFATVTWNSLPLQLTRRRG